MVLSVKNAGSWATVKDLYVKQGGIWIPVQKAFVRSAGAWVEYYAAEVVAVVSASVNNLIVSTLFSPDDWASTKKKRVIIQPGVVVGATSTAAAALRTGTGRGGLLFIENGGDIRGAGGAANGGAGGPAVNVQQAGMTLDNSGYIRGGGGGGGKGGTGGTGGQGYYVAYSHQAWGGNINWRWETPNGVNWITWAGSTFSTGIDNPALTSFSTGGITYHRGLRTSGSENADDATYRVSRDVPYNVYTNGGAGGAGGNGGRGIGHGQSNAAGVAGANGAGGGTNAGAGGKGGTGGTGATWGTAGAKGTTGNTGAGGNHTGGSAGAAGAAGGAAGAAIAGLARTLLNTGTIQGAT